MREARATNKPTAHPSWREIVKECIATSDAPTRRGVSRNAIKKFAAEKYKLNTPAHVSQLKRAISVGVDGGFFVQPKGPSGCVNVVNKNHAFLGNEMCQEIEVVEIFGCSDDSDGGQMKWSPQV
ncbi:hypothetical protein B0H14DRAFT_3778298 [Mycena olivaceomarginata]|nr:hypothetical protein B0H14DRAFT_3778298 [Mycena olivaceomarginata]